MGTTLRILFLILKFSLRHQENLFPILKSFLFYGKDLRISVAAILLLEKDGKYVLIKNHHREENYAPIGGVFKHSGKLPQTLHDIEWVSDYTTHEPKSEDMKNDLRGVIKAKNLARFLDWFTSRKGREGEQALYREIDEELSEGRVGKIWRTRSSKIKIEMIKKVVEGPRAVEDKPYQAQFRYFEIYEIDPQCEKGKVLSNELFKRAEKRQNRLITVTKSEINSGRITVCRSPISGSTKYYFSSKWHGNEPTPY